MLQTPPSPSGTTPQSATSATFSSHTRDDSADADSSTQRKRPRLDNGDHASQGMPADRADSPSSPRISDGNLGHFQIPKTPTKALQVDGSASASPGPKTELARAGWQAASPSTTPSLITTPNRMTINIRESDSSTLSNTVYRPISQPKISDHDRESAADQLQTSSAASARSSNPPMTIPEQEVVAQTKGLAGNPAEIEVAELEDVSEITTAAEWIKTPRTESAAELNDALMRDLPRLRGYASPESLLEELAIYLQRNPAAAESTLIALSNWVKKYTAATQSIRSNWYELFTIERDFWDKLPTLYQVACSSLTFPEHPKDARDDPAKHPVIGLLSAFTAITARILQTDLQTLEDNKNDTNVSPDLLSQPYIELFTTLLRCSPDHRLYSILRNDGHDANQIAGDLPSSLVSQLSNGFTDLLTISLLLLERASQSYEHLMAQKNLVKNLLVRSFWACKNESSGTQSALSVGSDAKQYFKKILEQVRKMIKTQHSALNSECLRPILLELSDIMALTMRHNAANFDEFIPIGYEEPYAALELDDQVLMLDAASRIDIFRMCIVHGRMEARVGGVDGMQDLLISAYRRYNRKESSQPIQANPPIIDFLASFIRTHSLLSYLTGVESHPQLVSRSSNIVGFLLVSRNFKSEDADIIWNSMVKAQDSRMSDAIMHSIKGFLSFGTKDHISYFFQKFFEVTAADFDVPMQDLCHWVTITLLAGVLQPPKISQDISQLYSLFLQILRSSFVVESLPPLSKRELYHFATRELRELTTSLPLPEEERSNVISDCIDKISSDSDHASGSISALAVLLNPASNPTTEDDWNQLQDRWHLLDLLLDSLVYLRQTAIQTGAHIEQLGYALRDRIHCVCMFIKYLPRAFTPRLAAQTWSSFVGSQALDYNWREMAWQFLTDVAASSKGVANPFLDHVLAFYFADLEGHQLTPGVLPFGEYVSQYYETVEKPSARARGSPLQFSVHEIYWTIALETGVSTVAVEAINRLVKHQFNRDALTADLENLTDNAFVEKGMRYLMRLAEHLKLDEDSSNSFSKTKISSTVKQDHVSPTLRTMFKRTVAILMKFHELAQLRLQLSPNSSSLLLTDLPENTLEVSYEVTTAGSTSTKSLKIGKTATLRQLSAVICAQIGASKIRISCGDQVIDPANRGNSLVRDSVILTSGCVHVLDVSSMTPPGSDVDLLSLDLPETQIMKHFSELYQLLSYEGNIGGDIYQFLTSFAPHQKILSQLEDEDVPYSQIFPSQAKYQSMYAAYALGYIIRTRAKGAQYDPEILARGARLLENAVLSLHTDRLDPVAALLLTETLLTYLRHEGVPTKVVKISDTSTKLIQQLGKLVGASLVLQTEPNCIKLGEVAFATILEVIFEDEQILSDPVHEAMIASLLHLLLLETGVARLHVSTKASVQEMLNRVLVRKPSKSDQYFKIFWVILCELVAKSQTSRYSTEALFTLSIDVFCHMSSGLLETLPLADYIAHWSTALCGCKPQQGQNNEAKDWKIFGLSELISSCILSGKINGRLVPSEEKVISHVWEMLLFPRKLESSTTGTDGTPPILDSQVRGSLYRLILAMSDSPTSLQLSITLCHDLVQTCNTSNAWSWGFAQIAEHDSSGYSDNWQIESSGLLRTSEAYPGLKNLSNTCYLNSLLSQLFMNTKFRSFIFSLELQDPRDTQRLLWETQRLFGYQQQSWLHAVDTESFADTMITYDGTPVDVTVQMDVDEFYNLLFDRLDTQIQETGSKQTFKSFYSGHIIQQIKSKDCNHISEREEPFSAIQCDIQGKQNLFQSLQAYVEGEAMEGENKYSCTACGEYVNAVKRACFRDVPDNLIFHLKRFDFDLTSGVRSKINDYFEFPNEVDMGVFNVEYLKDTTNPHQPDVFVLVGILVHSGQAEAGHYYSFIRDVSRSAETWFEFNDTEVELFDPANIGSCCFGGYQEPPYQGNGQKNFNAYMLFYTRRSTIGEPSNMAVDRQLHKPQVPKTIATEIMIDNVHSMKKICMVEEQHGNFVKQLLKQYKNGLRETVCSEEHTLQKMVIHMAILQVYQILGRCLVVEPAIQALRVISGMVSECSTCATWVLKMLVSHRSIIKDIFLRCLQPRTRSSMAQLIECSLRQVRNHNSSYYGLYTPNSSQESLTVSEESKEGAFKSMAHTLLEVMPELGYSKSGWTTYFELLKRLALFGETESQSLHSLGYLNFSLRYLAISYSRVLAKHWRGYQQFARACEKFDFPLVELVSFVSVMLVQPNNSGIHEPEEDDVTNLRSSIRVFSEDEWSLLNQTIRTSNRLRPLQILLSVFYATRNQPSVCEEFVRSLSRAPSLRDFMVDTFRYGLEDELGPELPSLLAGTAVYLEVCPVEQHVMELVAVAAKESQWVETNPWAAPSFLDFFTCVHEMRVREQQVRGVTTDPLLYQKALLLYAPRFAPSLLTCEDHAVRDGTLSLLQKLIFDQHGADKDDMDSEELEKAAARIFKSCINWIETHRQRGFILTVPRIQALQQALLAYVDRFGQASDLSEEESQSIRKSLCGALESLDKITSSSPEAFSSGDMDSQECSDGSNA